MRKVVSSLFVFVLSLLGAALLAVGPGEAAMPSSHAVAAGTLELVDGGCGGPMYYRAINGFCYRKRLVYVPPPRRYYVACAYGWHPTPYGCRPNYY